MSDEHASLIDAAYQRGYDEGYTDGVAHVPPLAMDGDDLLYLADVLRALGKWKKASS